MSEVEVEVVASLTAEQIEATEKAETAASKAEMYKFLSENFSDAPTEEKVEGWKLRHRRIRLLPLSDEEVYFIRPLKRSEYKALLQTATTAGGADPDSFLRERIVASCTLWPVMDTAQFSDTLGGTVDSLYQVIMDASNFLSQESLFTRVREL